MKTRGPDDEGYLVFTVDKRTTKLFGRETPAAVQSYLPGLIPEADVRDLVIQAGFAHRRLSIIDLSPSGHQPMSSSDERFHIVYNGEIYNYEEIRANLVTLGVVFRSRSDTEVILQAYILWGSDCLSRFNGDFAFVIYDRLTRKAFCARDRLGIKPFYYVKTPDLFLFGSDIKSLIASGLYHPQPDPTGLYLAMSLGMAPRPRTAFSSVCALEQGTYMILSEDGTLVHRRYWSIPIGTSDKRMSEGEARELIENELRLSVKRRLIADVSVGTFMSGGIDSTTISAIASQFDRGIKSFTIGFKDAPHELDEVEEARINARLNGTNHHIHLVSPDDCLLDIENWVRGYEEPYYSGSSTYELAKAVKQSGTKVVLNGLGGDELFAGYSYYALGQQSGAGLPTWLARALLPIVARTYRTRRIIRELNLSSQPGPAQKYAASVTHSADDELYALFSPDFLKPIDTVGVIVDAYAPDPSATREGIEIISQMDLMNYIGNHQVHRVDQFLMAFSIEGRFPFLDHEFIAAAFKVPSGMKLKNGTHKHILREVARKYIAPESLSMKKKGFGMPIEQWMKTKLKTLVYSSLEDLKNRQFICGATVSQWLKMYEQGKMPAHRIWHLVSLELWYKSFIESKKLHLNRFV